jgi:prevent-host-death family protein
MAIGGAMVKQYSIAEARDNFTSMVHEAEKGTQVELTRRGKPVAVLIGAEDFERLSKGTPSFSAAYEKFRRDFDLEALDINSDEIFGDLRDLSPGRDFNW